MPTVPIELVLTRLAAREPRVVADDSSDWRHAAVAAIFRDGPQGAELLFIQRAVHERDPWSGQIGFPGGRAEETDGDLLYTAARETREELGLDLLGPATRSLGPLDQLQARARRRVLAMAITPFAFVHEADEPPSLSPNQEVDDAFWVPLHDLVDPARWTWYDALRADSPYTFRAIDVGRGPAPLWGLTHYMTVEILHRLGLVESVDRLTIPRAAVD